MLWAWLPSKSGGAIQGRIQDFPNWGVETHGTKSGGGGGGGGGVLYALGPIRKAVRGGGGEVGRSGRLVPEADTGFSVQTSCD